MVGVAAARDQRRSSRRGRHPDILGGGWVRKVAGHGYASGKREEDQQPRRSWRLWIAQRRGKGRAAAAGGTPKAPLEAARGRLRRPEGARRAPVRPRHDDSAATIATRRSGGQGRCGGVGRVGRAVRLTATPSRRTRRWGIAGRLWGRGTSRSAGPERGRTLLAKSAATPRGWRSVRCAWGRAGGLRTRQPGDRGRWPLP